MPSVGGVRGVGHAGQNSGKPRPATGGGIDCRRYATTELVNFREASLGPLYARNYSFN
jgi:hypothetical protein